MGLTSDSHEKRTYLTIQQGKIAKKVPEGTVGAVERESTNKSTGVTKTVYEMLYRDISGLIDSFEIDESGKFGTQIKIHMSDIAETFTLSIPLDSREGITFLKTIPNINFKDFIKFSPYNFKPEDSFDKKIGLTITQGGEKVKWYYTNETPNGMPVSAERLDMDDFKILMQQQEVFLKKKAKAFAERWKQAAGAEKPEPSKPGTNTEAKKKDLNYNNAGSGKSFTDTPDFMETPDPTLDDEPF